MDREDLIPDRLMAEYVCGRASCGAASTWEKAFPDSAFDRVEAMEEFFREHLLRGVERRCGSCEGRLRAGDLKKATYACWCGRVGQELILEIVPLRGTLRSRYRIRRLFLRPGGDREEVRSPHDPRLRSVMIDSILRAGALISERSGRSEEGMVLIQRAIGMDPDYAMGHARLGEALFREGMVEEAEEALRAAITRDGTCEPALDLLARICHSSGRWGEAEAYFHRAKLASGGRPDLLLGEARAKVRLGRQEEAYEACRELLGQEAESLPALRLAAVVAEEVEPDQALPLLERLAAAAAREDHPQLRDLAEERLTLLGLPRFRPEVGEDPAASLDRLEEALRGASLPVDRWAVGGKEMPGRRTAIGKRAVFVRCFAGRFDAGQREQLTEWLRRIRTRSKKAMIQVYAPVPCPYAVRKATSALPEALLDVRSDSLVAPTDPGSSARALLEEAGPLGDLPDEPGPELLEALDRIVLDRFHDDGFGEMRSPTALLFAHLAGEAIRAALGGEWVDGDPVRILETPQGGVDLLAKVQALVTNGAEDSIAYLLDAIRSGSP